MAGQIVTIIDGAALSKVIYYDRREIYGHPCVVYTWVHFAWRLVSHHTPVARLVEYFIDATLVAGAVASGAVGAVDALVTCPRAAGSAVNSIISCVFSCKTCDWRNAWCVIAWAANCSG